MDQTPIYAQPFKYAKEAGEIPAYRASMKANIACQQAIEAAIRDNYDGMRLDSNAAWTVIEQYGFERPLYVLAATVQLQDWDGRYSPAVKEWAKTVPVAMSHDASGHLIPCDFKLNSHPGLLDLLTKMILKEQKVFEQTKPSIMQKLSRPPIHGNVLHCPKNHPAHDR